jgi:hypothetical protein
MVTLRTSRFKFKKSYVLDTEYLYVCMWFTEQAATVSLYKNNPYTANVENRVSS